jgi:hypothetical protein
METKNIQENNKQAKSENMKVNSNYENEMNLNEMAINATYQNIKNIPQEKKKESEKYFDRFYYSMWLSNKD